MRRNRRVKILATLGPASSAPEVIESYFLAGVDVFRINMSHSSFDMVRGLHSAVRAAEMKPAARSASSRTFKGRSSGSGSSRAIALS